MLNWRAIGTAFFVMVVLSIPVAVAPVVAAPAAGFFGGCAAGVLLGADATRLGGAAHGFIAGGTSGTLVTGLLLVPLFVAAIFPDTTPGFGVTRTALYAVALSFPFGGALGGSVGVELLRRASALVDSTARRA